MKETLYIKISGPQRKNRTTYESFFEDTDIILAHDDMSNVELPALPVIMYKEKPIIQQHTTIPKNLFKQLYSAVPIQANKPMIHMAYPLGFFHVYNVPYATRFDYCHLRENSFKVKQIEREHTRYAFVFDDPKRGFVINRNKVAKLPIVTQKEDYNTSILAYRDIIENAEEVHCIDSSFFHLVNSFRPKGKLFYHKYVRPHSPEFKMHPEWVRIK